MPSPWDVRLTVGAATGRLDRHPDAVTRQDAVPALLPTLTERRERNSRSGRTLMADIVVPIFALSVGLGSTVADADRTRGRAQRFRRGITCPRVTGQSGASARSSGWPATRAPPSTTSRTGSWFPRRAGGATATARTGPPPVRGRRHRGDVRPRRPGEQRPPPRFDAPAGARPRPRHALRNRRSGRLGDRHPAVRRCTAEAGRWVVSASPSSPRTTGPISTTERTTRP